MLVLEIEFLTGLYRASLPDGSGAEWPPHPERIFSALVQAWGDGGRRDGERAALEWLETRPPPMIEADPFSPLDERDACTVFVPPNDARGTELSAMPERRSRQARMFRAVTVQSHPPLSARPAEVDDDNEVTRTSRRAVAYVGWDDEPTPEVFEALRALAHRVASLGHSSSLARFHFLHGIERSSFDAARLWQPDEHGPLALRTLYEGRLRDLERWYSVEKGAPARRPLSLSTQRYRFESSTSKEDRRNVFGDENDWFVFEGVSASSAFEPDILGLAHITRRMRDALLQAAGPNAPEVLSGHASPSVPSARPHIALLPLLNVGWEYATGDLLGLAVCLPRELAHESRRDERQVVLQALARFSASKTEDPEAPAVGTLRFQHGDWMLERVASPSRSSLRPSRYCKSARRWASVTPVQLDRFPHHDDALEAARIVAEACTRIGLPEPASVEFHKHSVVRGAPSAYPSRGSKHRPDWSFPKESKFKDRPRRHVVLTFDEAVSGPVLLGAGRYFGFGLCLPLSEARPGGEGAR